MTTLFDSLEPHTPAAASHEPVDAHIRRAVTSDLRTTFLVEAGAGTGKTRVLVERYVACLRDGAPVSSVVAITFTEKAAGELRQRIREQLEELVAAAPAGDEARARFEHALGGLDDAPISTIHSFAARLLRERPVEAGVDPAFVQLDQVASELLHDALWRDWLAGLLDRATTDDGDQRPDELGSPDPAALLAEALAAGVDITDIVALARLRFAERYAVGEPATPKAPELRHELARLDALVSQVAATEATCLVDDDALKLATVDLVEAVAGLPAGAPLHELGAALLALDARRKGYCPGNAGRAANWPGGKQAMVAARDDLCDAVHQTAGLYRRFVADLALGVAADYARYAANVQLDTGRLDFDDLLGRCRDLLAGAPGTPRGRVVVARAYFQERYRYVLVDEFQDTDPLQAEIVFFLAERGQSARTDGASVELEPGKLFLVGDPKQSIYRFRRADIAHVRGGQGRHLCVRARGRPDAELPHRALHRRLGQRHLQRRDRARPGAGSAGAL